MTRDMLRNGAAALLVGRFLTCSTARRILVLWVIKSNTSSAVNIQMNKPKSNMHSCYFNEYSTMLSLLKDENLDYIFSLKLATIKLIQNFSSSLKYFAKPLQIPYGLKNTPIIFTTKYSIYIYIYTHTHTHIYIYIYIYISICNAYEQLEFGLIRCLLIHESNRIHDIVFE